MGHLAVDDPVRIEEAILPVDRNRSPHPKIDVAGQQSR
jgi:hypothetical protein